jgi:hypothetical protein
MVAGANANSLDAVAREYDCCMAGTPALRSSTGDYPVPTAGWRNYASIFFS